MGPVCAAAESCLRSDWALFAQPLNLVCAAAESCLRSGLNQTMNDVR